MDKTKLTEFKQIQKQMRALLKQLDAALASDDKSIDPITEQIAQLANQRRALLNS